MARKKATEETTEINVEDKKISQNIQNARNALGISRKELAQKINEKETLVAEYENGTAIPSAGILNKIDKVLKTKVRVTAK